MNARSHLKLWSHTWQKSRAGCDNRCRWQPSGGSISPSHQTVLASHDNWRKTAGRSADKSSPWRKQRCKTQARPRAQLKRPAQYFEGCVYSSVLSRRCQLERRVPEFTKKQESRRLNNLASFTVLGDLARNQLVRSRQAASLSQSSSSFLHA